MRMAEALRELDRAAPGIPLLALGQTVFWDEPMKAGIASMMQAHGSTRQFVAGVHDTDYFAKIPGAGGVHSGFKGLPHNDTSTKDMWSAAAEFSALFGSETVVRREDLTAGGLRIHRLEHCQGRILDELTEAWGWRGVVSVGNDSLVAADVRADAILPELTKTLRWAIQTSVDCLEGESKTAAQVKADELIGLVCDRADGEGCRSLSDLYQSLIPDLYSFAASRPTAVQTTRTSHLLRLNRATSGLPRFLLLDLFIRPETRPLAVAAYNQAVRGSGLYELDRFGTGAIPFDVYIPKVGRGTLRLGRRGAVILTPQPQYLSFRTEPKSVADLAAAIEDKFGPDCAVIGKAVSLIGMLAAEFCFVFHEGASSYVSRSRAMHQTLNGIEGIQLHLHPILRLKYAAWDSLAGVPGRFALPQPLQGPIGSETISVSDFSHRRREAAGEQRRLLDRLGRLRRPIELIDLLEQLSAASHGELGEYKSFWKQQAAEHRTLQAELARMKDDIEGKVMERRGLYGQIAGLKRRRQELELEMGRHFRQFILEKDASAEALARRDQFRAEIDATSNDLDEARVRLRKASREQGALSNSPASQDAYRRKHAIECTAEAARGKLLREAVIASAGLEHADLRPSAWWFPLVSPDGQWFQKTMETAECRLEPLQ